MFLSNGTKVGYKGGLNLLNLTYQTLIFEGISTIGFFSLSDVDRIKIEKFCANLIRTKLSIAKDVLITLVRASPSFSLVISGSRATYILTLHVMMEMKHAK